MSAPARVRQLREDDASAYVEVRCEALEREPLAFAASPEDDRALSIPFVREAFGRSSQATFGAFAPELVGVVGIYLDPHRKAAHKAHLWGLYVTPAHRGSRIGRSLTEAALGFARALPGVSWVQLGVSATARSAIGLYRSVGFVTWATEPDALRVGADSVAVHHMMLALGGPTGVRPAATDRGRAR
jgi:ribosomal protein S18 acetylase RimI-like enzyme